MSSTRRAVAGDPVRLVEPRVPLVAAQGLSLAGQLLRGSAGVWWATACTSAIRPLRAIIEAVRGDTLAPPNIPERSAQKKHHRRQFAAKRTTRHGE